MTQTELRAQAGPQTLFQKCPADIAIFGGEAGCGKLLALNTPIPTPSGWTTMGDLKDGDLVLGRDGRPTRVVKAHPVQLSPECYAFETDLGAPIIACADHLWLTSTEHKQSSVKTTREIAASLDAFHSIPMASAWQLPETALSQDPYLLGRLLCECGGRIPLLYQRASIAQRLALWDGLQDNGGVFRDPALLNDVLELLWGLGIKARASGERVLLCQADKVYVTGCRPIPSVPMRCITVEAPDGLFLCGRQGLVTHNSYIELLEAARWVDKPKYRAGIFRRYLDDITTGGGLWDEALGLYPALGARMRGGNILDATWPSGAQVGFYGIRDEADKLRFQGSQFDLLCFDELTHFTESQFWYLLSRRRSRCGMKPYVRCTTNPDPNSWVKQLILPWLGEDGIPLDSMSGKILWITRDGDKILHWATREEALKHARTAQSLTFIRARLADNKLGDPNYRDALEVMDRVTRAALLEGNWNEVAGSGAYFNRAWFEMADAPPLRLRHRVRGWDRAGSAPTPSNPNPDWTACVEMAEDEAGNLWWLDAQRRRVEPGAVDEWMIQQTRQDGNKVTQARWQDPAQSGKAEAHATTKAQREAVPSVQLDVEVASKNKESYAKILSARCDSHVQERTGQKVYMVRGDWNSWLLSALEAFPSKEVKDDPVDAASRAYLHIHHKRSSFATAFLAGMRR